MTVGESPTQIDTRDSGGDATPQPLRRISPPATNHINSNNNDATAMMGVSSIFGGTATRAGPPTTASSIVSTSSSSASGTSEAVKVIVRCRPLSDVEIAQGHRSIISMDVSRGIIEISNPKESQQPSKCFSFDAVYDANSKQIDLYDESFRDLIESVLCGFNGTIFAYGQTGTGKTFTMEGIPEKAELRGVIPNAIEHIFSRISQSAGDCQYLVRASYLEIYQEEIRDLLDSKDAKRRLELKERSDIGVFVKDLSSFVTKSVEEIQQLLAVGHANRSVGCTNMNEHSSRSHAIFILTVECSELGADGESHIRVGRLNLVDLAGSERQSKTGTQGQRFREATKINLSLSALGNVISALVDNKGGHIPYRDSKLTRLLQDSLGGNSKTVMVANIGPASYNYEETMSTLRYASRAKNIQNKPKINEDPKDALLREFQDEILRLKALLEKRGRLGNGQNRRRRRRTADATADDDTRDEGVEDLSAEEYAHEQQLKLDLEREELLRSTSIVDEEKRRMLEALEARAVELAREREMQAVVAAKIRAMQSKLLSGDGNIFDQTRQQQELLQRRRLELAEQKKREREVAQRLEAQEDSTAEIRETFASLQQEVDAKTRKLNKFLAKLEQVRMEIRDSADANAREREELASDLSDIDKELKLKCLLIENFIPPDFVEHFKENAVYDADEERWIFNGDVSTTTTARKRRPTTASARNPTHKSTDRVGNSRGGTTDDNNEAIGVAENSLMDNLQNGRRITDRNMIDSGLESSSGGGSGVSMTNNGTLVSAAKLPGNRLAGDEFSVPTSTANGVSFSSEASDSAQFVSSLAGTTKALFAKRPISMAGLRRPMCNFERRLLLRLQQRMQRTPPPGALGMDATSSSGVCRVRQIGGVSPPSSVVFSEVASVCCENLLNYESLVHFPSEVRNSPPDNESNSAYDLGLSVSGSDLVVETSKIPVSRTLASRNSRPESSRSRRTSSAAATAMEAISNNDDSVIGTYYQPQQYSSMLNKSKNVRARSVLGESAPQHHLHHYPHSSTLQYSPKRSNALFDSKEQTTTTILISPPPPPPPTRAFSSDVLTSAAGGARQHNNATLTTAPRRSTAHFPRSTSSSLATEASNNEINNANFASFLVRNNSSAKSSMSAEPQTQTAAHWHRQTTSAAVGGAPRYSKTRGMLVTTAPTTTTTATAMATHHNNGVYVGSRDAYGETLAHLRKHTPEAGEFGAGESGSAASIRRRANR